MNHTDIKAIESANPIIGVALELGIKVKGNVGKCFQEERHGPETDQWTLFFKPAQNSFFCRICSNIGGSVVDLVCQRQAWDRETALDWLAHRNEFDRMTRKLYYKRS